MKFVKYCVIEKESWKIFTNSVREKMKGLFIKLFVVFLIKNLKIILEFRIKIIKLKFFYLNSLFKYFYLILFKNGHKANNSFFKFWETFLITCLSYFKWKFILLIKLFFFFLQRKRIEDVRKRRCNIFLIKKPNTTFLHLFYFFQFIR